MEEGINIINSVLENDEIIDNPKYFIKEIINSRILGTGVHYSNPKIGIACISYRSIKIWGIKKALHNFIEEIYKDITKGLKIKLENSEFGSGVIEENLKKIHKKYEINTEILNQKINAVKNPIENWNYMDSALKTSVLINAFFDALDETQISIVENPKNWNTPLAKLLERGKNQKKINYYLEDFGFVFRARVYCSVYSDLFSNGAYSNLLARIDKPLHKLYLEYFVNERKSSSTKRTGHELALNEETNVKSKRTKPLGKTPEETINVIIDELNSGDKNKILDALKTIENKKMVELKENLEYLMNNQEDEIMNRALDVYMSLTQ